MAMFGRDETTMRDRRDSDATLRRDTHRGLGEVEASFLPSDPSELAPEGEDLGRGGSFDFQFPGDARLPSIPEDPRALDDQVEDEGNTLRSPDRRRFDTSTGGGSNRVSGGRDVARAYVAPMTPAPVHLRSQDTISVEVSEQLNQFDTIPSMNRRKLAEHQLHSVPRIDYRRKRLARTIWVAALAIVGGIALGLVVRASSETEDAPAPAPGPTAPALAASQEPPATSEPHLAAAPAPDPIPAAAATTPGKPLAEEAPEAPAAPSDRPRSTVSPKPTKSPPKPTKPSKPGTPELWLE